MKKIMFGLVVCIVLGFAVGLYAAAKTENKRTTIDGVVAYGYYNGTLTPIKVNAAGTLTGS